MSAQIAGIAYAFGANCAYHFGSVIFGTERALVMIVTDSMKFCGSHMFFVNSSDEIVLVDTHQYTVRMRPQNSDLIVRVSTPIREREFVLHAVGVKSVVAPPAPAAPASQSDYDDLWQTQQPSGPAMGACADEFYKQRAAGLLDNRTSLN
jgi:hypothetical protein